MKAIEEVLKSAVDGRCRTFIVALFSELGRFGRSFKEELNNVLQGEA